MLDREQDYIVVGKERKSEGTLMTTNNVVAAMTRKMKIILPVQVFLTCLLIAAKTDPYCFLKQKRMTQRSTVKANIEH